MMSGKEDVVIKETVTWKESVSSGDSLRMKGKEEEKYFVFADG